MEKQLTVENLSFNRGNESFQKEEFIKHIKPFFADLNRVGRTNYLFVATFGDGTKPEVTGYATETTINATINSRAIKSETTGGKWAVYQLV